MSVAIPGRPMPAGLDGPAAVTVTDRSPERRALNHGGRL